MERDSGLEISLPPPDLKQGNLVPAPCPGNTRFAALPGRHGWVFSPGFAKEADLTRGEAYWVHYHVSLGRQNDSCESGVISRKRRELIYEGFPGKGEKDR